MVRLGRFLKKYLFFLLLPAAFLAGDFALSVLGPPYYISSGRFYLNDYEVTRRDHPEEVWDKVFFGNSVVISGYREDLSSSGYINLGLDYGVVTDLWEMLQKGTITVGSDLVVGLNYLTMYDDFETNPSYPWHQRAWEPYCYFARDRLRTLFEETVQQVFLGYQPPWNAYFTQTKIHYYGAMSTQALQEKESSSQYAHLPIDAFRKNFDALADLADYCEDHGIRMRVVWMPMNPDIPAADIALEVRDAARELCGEKGVAFQDLGDMLDSACFYDTGHLNYEYGAYQFTEGIDPWLNS